MSGWLRIIGLGPGSSEWLTPQASEILHAATDIIGYTPYVNAVPASITAKRHASPNGVEVERAKAALQLAANGARVAVVSGGDAGIFGMASAVFEALEEGNAAWRTLDIEVIPGMTALLAASARVGAPLGHDFCVISLSDYLKPWEIIERRLQAAVLGDFVLAIYNPASQARREQLNATIDYLKTARGEETIAILAQSIGRQKEQVQITTLGKLDVETVDMLSLLIIGSSHTRIITRETKPPFVYTPRYYGVE